jgi:hypothetical protein
VGVLVDAVFIIELEWKTETLSVDGEQDNGQTNDLRAMN